MYLNNEEKKLIEKVEFIMNAKRNLNFFEKFIPEISKTSLYLIFVIVFRSNCLALFLLSLYFVLMMLLQGYLMYSERYSAYALILKLYHVTRVQ